MASLGSIVGDLVQDCSDAAAHAGISLESRATAADIIVETDPRLLAMAIKGLVLYAIKFGAGDRVVVKVRQRGARPCLDVDYTGSQIGNPIRNRISNQIGNQIASALTKQSFIELPPLGTAPPRLVLGLGLAFVAVVADRLGIALEQGRARGATKRLSLVF